jgi:hypothetical protein
MDIKNSIRRTFTEDEEWQGQVAKTQKKPTIKVNYKVPANSELRVYQSPVGYTWTYDTFTISGFGSKEVGVNGSHYYVWFKSGDDADATLSTYLVETINDEFAVSVVGMNFDEDGKLLVSGAGGGTGGDASAELQQEQIDVATASNTNLGLIATAAEDMLLSVDGINTKLNPLQIQSAKYTIEAVSQFAPDTVPAFTFPPAGIAKDEGWYYKNLVNGQVSQLYFYSYLNPAMSVAGRQFTYTLADITMSYCVVRLLAVNSAEGLATLGIYTRPTGSGDAVPGFFKSRKVYNIPSTAKLTQGMEVMLYWGVEPNLKLHPGVSRIQLQLATTVGTAAGTEQLAFLSLNTDSAALAGNAEYIVSAAGFQYAGELIMNNEFTGESSQAVAGGDASAANQVSSNTAICARLDSSNIVLSAIQEILGDSVNVINFGLLNDTPQYIPIRASSTGNLHVYDAQVHSELLTLNAQIDAVIDDGAGALKVVGDFYQASQPVEFTSAQDVNLFAGAALTHTQTGENQYSLDVNVNNSSVAVTGTFYQETQPVSIAELAFTAEDELIVYDNSAVLKLTDIDTKIGGIETQTDLLSFVPQLTYNSLRVNVDNEIATNIQTMPAITVAESQTIGLVENTVVGLAPNSSVGVSGEVSLTAGTQVGIDPFNNSVSVSNQFATESTADAIKTQTDKLTFLNIESEDNLKVIDVALNTTVGQLSFITDEFDVTDLRVRVMNDKVSVSGTFFQDTQPVSVADPVNTHLYGFHNDDWVSVKVAGNGHLLVNSSTQDGDGNDITSTSVSGTETYTALDVAVKNSVIVSEITNTISVRAQQFGSFGNLCNSASIPSGGFTAGINVADWSYYIGIYEDFNVSTVGNITLQYSFDDLTYYDFFNTMIVPAGTPRRASIPKTDIPGINYIRLHNGTTTTLSSVTLTLLGATL